MRREEDALRQRRPTYRIAEPVVRFYFAVMRPHLSLEHGAAEQVWPLQTQAAFSSQILGPHFEDIARAWMSRYASAETLGGPIGRVSSTVVQDRSARSHHEVDVVAVAPRGGGRRRVVALGEAKWRQRPMGKTKLERLEQIRDLLDSHMDIDMTDTRFFLFSPAGFTKGLRQRAHGDSGVQLIDPDRLYAGD